MSAFLKILEEVRAENRQIVVAVNGSERIVLVTDITDDAVTLKEVDAETRYDLHYTQVVMVGS
jgi:hypothetical protein